MPVEVERGIPHAFSLRTTLVAQALSMALSNAVDATPADMHPCVSLRAWIVWRADSGSGSTAVDDEVVSIDDSSVPDTDLFLHLELTNWGNQLPAATARATADRARQEAARLAAQQAPEQAETARRAALLS